MFVVPGRKVTSVTSASQRTTQLPIYPTPFSVSMMPSQPVNAFSPICRGPFGSAICFKSLHPKKAASPIRVTLSGMTICSRAAQSENVYCPISVTPSGMTALSSEAQS